MEFMPVICGACIALGVIIILELKGFRADVRKLTKHIKDRNMSCEKNNNSMDKDPDVVEKDFIS